MYNLSLAFNPPIQVVDSFSTPSALHSAAQEDRPLFPGSDIYEFANRKKEIQSITSKNTEPQAKPVQVVNTPNRPPVIF